MQIFTFYGDFNIFSSKGQAIIVSYFMSTVGCEALKTFLNPILKVFFKVYNFKIVPEWMKSIQHYCDIKLQRKYFYFRCKTF